MLSGSLWAEVTIAGSLFVFAVFFIALKLLGIRDISFLVDIKDYLAYLSIGVVVSSYILGILAHRSISVILLPFVHYIKHHFLLTAKTNISEPDPSSRSNMVLIWQYGSKRLQREIDYQFNFLAFFNLLTVGLPVLGLSSAIWLAGTTANSLAIPAFIAGVTLGIASRIAQRFQVKQYQHLVIQASIEIERLVKSKKE